MIPTLFCVTLLLFGLFNLVGGDPARRFAGKHATAEQVQTIRVELGLDRSLPEQYFNFLKQVVTFDFGRSWATQQQISTMISDGVGATLSLSIPYFIISSVLCIVLALFTAYHRGGFLDKSVVVSCLALLSISSLVYILLGQYFLAFKWGIFPISGWDPGWVDRWQYLVLPWIVLLILTLGPEILVFRTVILDEVYQDYARTARAKGLSPTNVYLRHVLKNAMIPIITSLTIQLPYLVTGAVLVEFFFSIPGIGGMLLKAINDSDFPTIKAMTVIFSMLYMVFNLIGDIMYAVVDPRIKLS